MKISENTLIWEIIQKHPETSEIFLDFWLWCSGCFASEFETIWDIANAHMMTPDEIKNIIDDLNEIIANKSSKNQIEKKYKVVFASSSKIWLVPLMSLIEDKRFFVSLVITWEDKKIWRKQILTPNEIKKIALEEKINFVHPKSKKELDEILEKEKPDFFLVVAFWMIIPEKALSFCKFPINIHWSILPKYRWASPIQESILNWDKKSWISIMEMVKEMDAWWVYKVLECKILEKDNQENVFEKLWYLSANIWEILDNIYNWKLKKIEQNSSKATYTKKITKENWQVFFKKDNSKYIFNKFRAYFWWPWIYSFFGWKIIKFTDIDFDISTWENYNTWEVFEKNSKIFVKWISGNIELKKIQLEWKKDMSIKDFLNWNKNFLGFEFD